MAVKTSWATRMRTDARSPGAANARLTSIVAVPLAIEMPRSLLPCGTAEPTPAAVSGGFGPVNRRSIAAVATPGVCVTVRLLCQSMPPRSKNTSSLILGPACAVAVAELGPAMAAIATAATRMLRACMDCSFRCSAAPQPPFRVTGISTTWPPSSGFTWSGETTT